jgi:hypothetical protein
MVGAVLRPCPRRPHPIVLQRGGLLPFSPTQRDPPLPAHARRVPTSISLSRSMPYQLRSFESSVSSVPGGCSPNWESRAASR